VCDVFVQSSFHWYYESHSKAVKCRPSVATEFSMGPAVTVAGASQWTFVPLAAAWSDTVALWSRCWEDGDFTARDRVVAERVGTCEQSSVSECIYWLVQLSYLVQFVNCWQLMDLSC